MAKREKVMSTTTGLSMFPTAFRPAYRQMTRVYPMPSMPQSAAPSQFSKWIPNWRRILQFGMLKHFVVSILGVSGFGGEDRGFLMSNIF